jgi:hypothetical protein
VSGEWDDAVYAQAPVSSVPRGNDLDTRQPHPARIYDYWLGGKDNYAADREVAQRVPQAVDAGCRVVYVDHDPSNSGCMHACIA